MLSYKIQQGLVIQRLEIHTWTMKVHVFFYLHSNAVILDYMVLNLTGFFLDPKAVYLETLL